MRAEEYSNADIQTEPEINQELAKCNKTAAICHTVEIIVISLAYIMEYFKGTRTLPYVLLTIVIGMAAPALEWFFYNRKHDTTMVKHVLGYGFGLFYIFIMMTTNNTLVFTYVVPMFIAISVFNDYKFSIPVNVCCVLVNCVQAVIFIKNGVYTMDNLAGLEIQILVMIIIAAYSMYSCKVLEQNNSAKLKKIKEHGDKTAVILHNTMEVADKMGERIHVIDSKIKELDEAISATREAMHEVTVGSGDTAEAVQKQLEMTEDIQHKVDDVRGSTDQIITDIMEAQSAVSQGNNNVSVLIERVNTSVEDGKMVTNELEQLKAIMSDMNSVVDIITGITSQTSLLALNASIEAARAGEAGKGFAVVATEISKMAGETQDATVKITDMIGNVSDAINRVVDVTAKMVEEISGQHEAAVNTEESFNQIKSSSSSIDESSKMLSDIVEKLAKANKEIVDSVSTISAISEEVSAHANDTFQISEQNSHTVGEVVEISDELKELTAKLNS